MNRLNVFLLLALVCSAMYLVHVSYEARRLFTELDRAQRDEHRLGNDYERLKTERQSQATPLRVEKAAREKLGMRSATPAVTQYVTYVRAAASAAATSAKTNPSSGRSPSIEKGSTP